MGSSSNADARLQLRCYRVPWRALMASGWPCGGIGARRLPPRRRRAYPCARYWGLTGSQSAASFPDGPGEGGERGRGKVLSQLSGQELLGIWDLIRDEHIDADELLSANGHLGIETAEAMVIALDADGDDRVSYDEMRMKAARPPGGRTQRSRQQVDAAQPPAATGRRRR